MDRTAKINFTMAALTWLWPGTWLAGLAVLAYSVGYDWKHDGIRYRAIMAERAADDPDVF